MNLKRLRKKIDTIDSEMLKLLNRRAEIILDVGRIKRKSKSAAYVPEREKDIYDRLLAKNSGPMSNDALRAILREIMSSSLSLEHPVRIAYLGPEFTFTHLASIKKFGASVSYTGCETITDVFAEVEKLRADYGVVPIENSIDGAVTHTQDMFIDSELKICSEVYLEVSHNLLSNESDKRKIRKVYSKSQVFGQCRLWIEANLPGVELVEVSSTAKAAEIVSKERFSACIAGELAAKKYKLKTLCGSIEDSFHNVTRFLVIGKIEARPTKKDKTSIMFSVKDRAGALHDILVPFKRHGISMTKIESRPSKVRAWEYYFFVDIKGHHHEPKVAKALRELGRSATYMKILGSYPIGDNV
ncbi:MAG: prephenate dehydratase [Candidatus Omnitrophica bacterium]|nr:prephenate dehydratase [Candidatus Omnitrophota bacterium]